MRLKELLLSTDFNALVPYLKKEGDLFIRQYREAYDILCHLTPANDSKIKYPKIIVEWHTPDEGFEDEEPYINVHNCEGDLWECNVAKEVVVADNCKLNKEEVVAKILWSCTFYGYTPQTTKEDFENRIEHKMHTLYGLRARRLEQRLYFNYLPGNAKRESIYVKKLSGRDSFSLSSEEWDYCHKRMKKASRIKKKRDRRLKKRIDDLDHKEKYEYLRAKFLGGKGIAWHDMDFIYDGYHMFLTQMETHTYGEMSRVNYVKMLTSYNEQETEKEFISLQKLVVACRVSSASPLTEKETKELKDIFKGLIGKAEFKFGTIQDDSFGNELHLTILSQTSKKRTSNSDYD